MDFERRKTCMLDQLTCDIVRYCEELDMHVPDEIPCGTTLRQLGFNSLDTVDFLCQEMMRYKLKIPRNEIGACKTVDDYAGLFAKYLR